MIYKLYVIGNFLYKKKIGKGTTFPHLGLGVLIHPNATIGENCKILQGVSIGGRSGHKELPKIGNNVLIGAHALILGPIKIGDNAIIGAGAVVIHDVPQNTTVVGNPAREIKTKTNEEEKYE